jgi:hypothetical protein
MDPSVDEFPKPKHILRAHGGPFEGQSIDEIVQSPEGRAWLARFIPSRPPKHQLIGLAWLSWAMQHKVTLEDLDEIAGGAS